MTNNYEIIFTLDIPFKLFCLNILWFVSIIYKLVNIAHCFTLVITITCIYSFRESGIFFYDLFRMGGNNVSTFGLRRLCQLETVKQSYFSIPDADSKQNPFGQEEIRISPRLETVSPVLLAHQEFKSK